MPFPLASCERATFLLPLPYLHRVSFAFTPVLPKPRPATLNPDPDLPSPTRSLEHDSCTLKILQTNPRDALFVISDEIPIYWL
jgi:hypothetical protein